MIAMKAKSAAREFPIVCVGGSAGGLDAYTRLLRHLPADMGVAIVKNDQTNKPNGPIKEILGLPLTPRFREYLSQL